MSTYNPVTLDLTYQIRQTSILPMVISVASSEWRKSGSLVDYEDVVGEALLGLMTAHKRYRKGHKTKFSTWANFKIRGAVLDLLRRERTNARKYVVSDTATLDIPVKTTLEHRIAMRQQIRVVLDVMNRELDVNYSKILIMFYLLEVPEKEIATLFRCSEVKISKDRRKALLAAHEAMVRRGHYGIV